MGVCSPIAIWYGAESCKCFICGFIPSIVHRAFRAKYPLALTKKILDTFSTSVLFGYNIGCGFTQTVHKSGLVGPVLKATGSRFCVGAFHGHAHARLCQLNWHPTHVKGAGLEDFETCERFFSSSNRIASSTRHSSRFHRRQSTVRQIRYWKDEKYRESCK